MTPEIRIAEAVTQCAPEADDLAIMRLALFDWAVCAAAGRDEPVARILRQQSMTNGAGGAAAVVGGDTAAPAQAALINGATSHALDYDDTHFAHIGHTSVSVMPVVLALSAGQSMQDVLRAALIGSEIAVRVGLWLGRDHYQIGFHQTATAGAFGAAMAAARLLELTGDQCINALGLAATKAAGLKSQFGTMGKPLNAGLAAETGVLAAQWAKAGMTSADAGLSGPLGFGDTHHGGAAATAFDGLGDQWLMADISHKFHACCHGLHATLEALGTLDGAVAALTVHTHPRWLSVCNITTPRTGLECKFSYRMVAAMALAGVNTAAIDSYSDDAAADPTLAKLCEKVTVVADASLSEMQARVDVAYSDGRTAVLFHDLGLSLDLATRQSRLLDKARAVVGQSKADDLWGAVQADTAANLVARLQR